MPQIESDRLDGCQLAVGMSQHHNVLGIYREQPWQSSIAPALMERAIVSIPLGMVRSSIGDLASRYSPYSYYCEHQ